MIDTYVQLKDCGYVGCEKILTSFTRNDYEPDLVFYNSAVSNHFEKDQWKFPVPDFIVEVLSDSTEEKDRGIKFEDYELHGVKEYWIIDTSTEMVEQYLLKNNKFALQLKTAEGHIESPTIHGFKIDVRAIFDKAMNVQALQTILANID